MTLQSLAQGVTQHLPPPLPAIATALLGDECYALLIWSADLSQTACLRLAVSKALGVGIIVFGSILKLPQMTTIVRHASAHGVSLAMYALEVIAYDISLAYACRRRLPFSTYGENASLTVQNMLITLLIIWYGEGAAARLTRQTSPLPATRARHVALAASAMVLASVFLFYICPSPLLAVLQALSIPISCVSKVPQILELHQNRETGHLSSVVVFAQLAGTIARVFTTVTETGDWLIGLGFGLASMLNAVIAAQYVYYWDGSKATHTSQRRQSGVLPLTQSSKAYHQGATLGSGHPPSRSRVPRGASLDMSQATYTISVDGPKQQQQQHAFTSQNGRVVHEKGHRAD